jgi:sarcosine oxidase
MVEHERDGTQPLERASLFGMRVERADVVVVGAGLLGLATARALRHRGREVAVLEQATVGHRRCGSYGASRIFRLGYPEPRYVHMASAALDLWRELEAETHQALLDVTGQVSFGSKLDDLFAAMVTAGAPAHWMSATEVASTFPEVSGDGPAIFEPASGVLDAPRCLAALRRGTTCEIRENERVHRVSDDDDYVTIRTDGAALRADVVVLCPGPWSVSVLAPLAPTGSFTTMEHVAYVRHRDGALPAMPVVIAHDPPLMYGLPTTSLGLYKIAYHHAGAVVDPDTSTLDADRVAVHELEQAARRWLPGFEPDAELVETCLYDNTPDGDFILGRRGRVVVGAGTSGHGFKFGPLLGEILADLAVGNAPRVPLDAFRLGRGDPSLRRA